jgi:hypothetical protein
MWASSAPSPSRDSPIRNMVKFLRYYGGSLYINPRVGCDSTGMSSKNPSALFVVPECPVMSDGNGWKCRAKGRARDEKE